MIPEFKMKRKLIKFKMPLYQLDADFAMTATFNNNLFLELYFLTLCKNPASF